MSRMRRFLSVAAVLMGAPALADVPNVAVDVAPVHSLVARIMDGVGEPSLIVQPGASPHEYGLRPSEAAALQDADLVFWIGEDLTPWMEDAIETLATGAAITSLLEADGTTRLDVRDGALFEADDDADHGAPGDDDHDDPAGQQGEEHGAYDPHAWLSPRNAGLWLDIIAARLSAADPDNAAAYSANAAAARAELDALATEVTAILDPVRGSSFIVFHDAYQYFEVDFEFPASGAISLGDASEPGPARIAEIQARIRDGGISCVLAEPQFNPGMAAAVLDGSGARTGVIDPLGAELDPGAALYPQLIRNMAQTLADCL